jgi:hypothetical protein
MNNRELVVRIIQPAEQPKPRPAEPAAPAEQPERKWLPRIMNALAVAAIAAVGAYLAVSFFHLGFSFNDILILVGMPLAIGLITTYAIF